MVDRHFARKGRQQLRGRRTECAVLDEVVTAVRAGESRALVVRGEAGVGKSVLLEHAVDTAADLTVLRAVGVESEMELAFASLHQLCAPVLDRLDRLPAPQREALSIVFGLTEGPPPDRFLVGLAVLSLLSEVAEGRPLLCAIDDAQWLDTASARALGFVARRIGAEPIGLLFSAREPGEALTGLPELEIRGLEPADAHALLRSVVRFTLDERVSDRIVAETRGNPLALVELPRGLTATQLAGGFGLLSTQALPARIEERYRQRLAELPPATARLLTIAAAEPVGDPLVVWRAAASLGIETSAGAAATDDLLTIDERVTFRHPLVRSAVYRSASPDDRRAAHLALANVTDPDLDPDRRAWHLAAAAAGPDEEVAAELERSAGRAQARGGLSAAAAFLQRSVALTAEPARRADRALAAVDASLRAGGFDDALALLATAEADALDDFQRARVDLLRAEAAFAQSRGSAAPPLLLRAARTLEPLDPRLARETYLDAWSAALFAGALAAPGGSMLDVSRAARVAPQPIHAARVSDLLLDGLAVLFTEGREAGLPAVRRAARGFTTDAATVEEVLRWGWLATAAAVVCWDFDTCLAAATRGVELARASGALAVLAVSVNVLAQAVTLGGDFAQAAVLVAEADSVTEATGTRVAPYGALVLAAHRGRESEAFPLIDRTIAEASAGGQGTAVQYARWSRAILLNGLGRYEEAAVAAREAGDDTPELFVSTWALSELIEAAIRSGDRETAAHALERLAARARPGEDDWARGMDARGRALVGEGETADRWHRESIAALGRTRLGPETARGRLLYGEWLRREGRRVEAREQLRSAHDEFGAIGMEAFAERARRELAATGERVRRRTPERRDDLTPQELQIASLARDGLSNPEIGARLFLSPRTVEWHLRKVFGKLGISSRGALRDTLPVGAPQAATG